MKQGLTNEIAVLQQLLIARRKSLQAKESAEILALQAEVGETEFRLVEAHIRENSPGPHVHKLFEHFMGCYRGLTPHISPENIAKFSSDGRLLLTQLQAALTQARQPTTT